MPSARSSRPGSSTSPPADTRSCICPTCTTTSSSARARPPSTGGFPTPSASPRRTTATSSSRCSTSRASAARTRTSASQGTEEVAGGLLGFSTTTAPPAAALQDSQDELLNRFRGSDDKYWGWRTQRRPACSGPAPIVSNTTTITNLSPNADGTVPAATSAPAPGGRPPAGLPAAAAPRAACRPASARSRRRPSRPRGSRTVQMRDGYRDSNFDLWYVNLQGQGSGSVNPFAENAYSGLMGSYPAALVWNSASTPARAASRSGRTCGSSAGRPWSTSSSRATGTRSRTTSPRPLAVG